MNNKYGTHKDPHGEEELAYNIANLLEGFRELDYEETERNFSDLKFKAKMEGVEKGIEGKLNDINQIIEKLKSSPTHLNGYKQDLTKLEESLLYVQGIFLDKYKHSA